MDMNLATGGKCLVKVASLDLGETLGNEPSLVLDDLPTQVTLQLEDPLALDGLSILGQLGKVPCAHPDKGVVLRLGGLPPLARRFG